MLRNLRGSSRLPGTRTLLSHRAVLRTATRVERVLPGWQGGWGKSTPHAWSSENYLVGVPIQLLSLK